jgi:hypothetical protein
MLSKKTGELSNDPHTGAVNLLLSCPLATSRRPNNRLDQILHACAVNGVGRLKANRTLDFVIGDEREWVYART